MVETDALSNIASDTQEERASVRATQVVEILRETIKADPPKIDPPDEPFTVAILGRTKAGKSQLIAALTGDVGAERVGVGRQRTTRKVSSHELRDFLALDTPGVGALHGDKDTEKARRAADKAHAVLWLYAESLQEQEADELESLLRAGKPVVVAFNAKWAVDDPERREVFCESPELAFRDLSGHEIRLQQIARRAGTNSPQFVPVHARAAWWSIAEPESRMAMELRRASRVDELVEACRKALHDRRAALVIVKTHDDCRNRLLEYAGACEFALGQLGSDSRELLEELRAESQKLTQAVTAAERVAKARLNEDFARLRGALPTWIKEVRQSEAQEQWQQLLEAHHIFRALDEFGADVAAESARSGKLFEATSAIRATFELRRRTKSRPGGGILGRLGSAFRVAGKALVRVAKSFGLSRGATRLFAKLGGRAVPGVNIALVIGDSLEAVSAELRVELRRRQLLTADWERDSRKMLVAEVDELTTLLHARLVVARTTLFDDIDTHYRLAERCLKRQKAAGRRFSALSRQAHRHVRECDRLLVERLASSQGLPTVISNVERIPNRELRVTCSAGTDARELQASLQHLLLSEHVSVVLRAQGKRRNTHESTQLGDGGPFEGVHHRHSNDRSRRRGA